MIQKYLKKLFGGDKHLVVIPAGAHQIRAEDISEHAKNIVKKLQGRGHTAYIVGGAVRDILLGCKPKDYDIATSAEPGDIRALFGRDSRSIGRRFPIVHVYLPRTRQNRGRARFREFIEVSTFRAKNDSHGRAPKYGHPSEDAHRRDFTSNGIFYDPISRDLYDYVGGVPDITARKLRMIGAASRRLPEDPVRILRALRLSVKLDLIMSDKLEQQLLRHVPLLADISHARLLDELIKVINCGAGARVFEQWRQFGVCRHILPALEQDNPLFFSVMAENDRRLAEQRDCSVSFVIAALFWPHTAARWHQHRANDASPVQAMEKAIAETPFRKNRIISQRLCGIAKDLFFMQAQMEYTPTERRANSILAKPMFDRALAFAALRQDEGAAQTASWWSQFAQSDSGQRARMLENFPKARRRRRKRNQRAGNAAPPPAAPAA